MRERYLVAGYGFPAEFAIYSLFGQGIPPDNIAILTHDEDDRNHGLHALARLRRIDLSMKSPRSAEAIAWARRFAPDALLSLHYRRLIPPAMLELPTYGCVNLHPSLLPRHRGTNAVAWVLIDGERETGFTFHRMDAAFDTGPILLQERLEIRSDDTAFSLFHRQIVRAMARVEEVLSMLLQRVPGTPQVGCASYHERELPMGGEVDPSWSLARIDRFIRAMTFPPFEPAFVKVGGERFPVVSVEQYLALATRIGLPIHRPE